MDKNVNAPNAQEATVAHGNERSGEMHRNVGAEHKGRTLKDMYTERHTERDTMKDDDMELYDMLDFYSEEYFEIVTERLHNAFNEFDFPPEAIIDFFITSLASMCVFSESPMKDANDISRELSKLVKELMKDGYGSKLIDQLKNSDGERKR
jgi:hypothetical protein